MREKTRLLTCDAMNSKVYVSFGGLLLYLEGPYKKLTPLRIDYVYLLIKK
jgi:DNA-directed RNA polymerase I, II, and III subunit RPABC3